MGLQYISKEMPCLRGAITQIAGPLWLGPFREQAFCDEVISELETHPLNTKDKAKKELLLSAGMNSIFQCL